ncbi:SDR family oxidoreductase [Streptomyces stelliscabiei]|uniref:SDR family oxidoreductase n=1 Tax=Streptomyces stelliscabiei TaxID=146820 RepID=UPI003A8CA0ED
MGDHQRAAYQSGKAGINALTRHVASHWGKQGIRCNCVSTGGGDDRVHREDGPDSPPVAERHRSAVGTDLLT